MENEATRRQRWGRCPHWHMGECQSSAPCQHLSQASAPGRDTASDVSPSVSHDRDVALHSSL